MIANTLSAQPTENTADMAGDRPGRGAHASRQEERLSYGSTDGLDGITDGLDGISAEKDSAHHTKCC